MSGRSFILLLVLSVARTAAAQQQDPLLNQFLQSELDEGSGPASGFLSPTGRFRFRVPGGFELQEGNDPDTLIWLGTVAGYNAKLVIKRLSVTPGASSSQLMLTTRDRFLNKLPNFSVLKNTTFKIAGRLCAVMIARFDYQGNKGYPMIIENGYVVDGGDGFIIHMETPDAGYQYAARELADVYKSFRMIAPPSAAPVAIPPPAPAPPTKKR